MNNDHVPLAIETLPNNGVDVLLMRRTTNITVKTSVGHRYATGEIRGWFGAKPPTHWINLPPFDNAYHRRKLKGETS